MNAFLQEALRRSFPIDGAGHLLRVVSRLWSKLLLLVSTAVNLKDRLVEEANDATPAEFAGH